MHAHAFSVSFPCVNLNDLGSRRPQSIKLKRTKVHAFIFYLHSSKKYRNFAGEIEIHNV